MNNRTQTQNDMQAMYEELRRTDKATDKVVYAIFGLLEICVLAIIVFSFIKG